MIPVRKAAVTPVSEERLHPEPATEEPAAGSHPRAKRRHHSSASPARVIIPQIIEELLPSRNRAAPPVEQEPAPVVDSVHEALTRSIQTAVRSLTVTEERAPEPLQIPEAVQWCRNQVPVVEAVRNRQQLFLFLLLSHAGGNGNYQSTAYRCR